MSNLFPLPFTCQHRAYKPGTVNGRGNTKPDWEDPVDVACVWWSPETRVASTEPASAPTGGDLATLDLVLVVDSSVSVDQRDTFTIQGREFEVIGLPKDFNHGSFGFSPDRHVIELKWVG